MSNPLLSLFPRLSSVQRERAETSMTVRYTIYALLLFATSLILLAPLIRAPKLLYAEDGRTTANEIIAVKDFSYCEEAVNATMREEAERTLPDYYCVDTALSQTLLQDIVAFCRALERTPDSALLAAAHAADPSFTFDEFFTERVRTQLVPLLACGIAPNDFASDTARICYLTLGMNRYREMYASSFFNTQYAGKKLADAALCVSRADSSLIKTLLTQAFAQRLKPNLQDDAQARTHALGAYFDRALKQEHHVQRGTVIIPRGVVPDAQQLYALTHYYRALQSDLLRFDAFFGNLKMAIAGILVFITLLVVLHRTCIDIVESNYKSSIFVFIILASFFVHALLIYYALPIFNNLRMLLLSYDVMPCVLGAALALVLFGQRAALNCGFFISMIISMKSEEHFAVLIGGCLLTLMIAKYVYNVRDYKMFFMRIFGVVCASFVMLILFCYLLGLPTYALTLYVIGGILTAGVIVAVLSLLLLFLIEVVFRAQSDMSLRAYIATDYPLLKELETKAPGTYYHAQAVATIAENAAQEINANPIRVRVAAMYHDIGKMDNPEFFTENSPHSERLHAQYSPYASARIIVGHVRKGLEIAKREHMPLIVRDAIAQHHGTDVPEVFYNKAVREAPEGEVVDRRSYAYPGPRPRSKECVIIALADMCEAAIRSMPEHTPDKIDHEVRRLIAKKVSSGQLKHARITFAELETVCVSIIKTLCNQYHERIPYPGDEPLTIMRKLH